MRFPPEFLEEIKARLPVSEVVRGRVKLAKSGREFVGLSPFNAEKTPSFYVNDQKQAWFDFSSGKNGSMFDFVMETEGLSFPEAVERLAGMAGLALPKVSRESEERERAKLALTDVMGEAARFFTAQLKGQGGAKARAYLAGRGLAPELLAQFGVGYAPAERFALRDHLAGKGASAEAMIEAGLLIHGAEIAVPYDRFRDRVMFPICDRSGRVIAFGGRAMEKDAQAKYLNSPETPLFHKSAVLYNHHLARKAAHDTGALIAVEGYVDVVSMAAVGFAHVVAPLGTALTAEQLALMWRMADEPILCFDGDKAGRKAAFRAIDTALPLIGPGKTLRFAMLPDGQDPDDLARSGGAAAISAVIEAARPLVDTLWAREIEAGPLDTPERRAGLERRLADVLRVIADEPLRRHYRQDMEARLAAMFGSAGGGGAPARGKRGWTSRPPSRGGRFPEPPKGPSHRPFVSPGLARSGLFQRGGAEIAPREALILLMGLNHPSLLSSYAEQIASLDLVHPELARLREFVVGLSGAHGLDHDEARRAAQAAGFGPLRQRMEAVVDASLWCVRPQAAATDAEEVLKQALALHRQFRALHREMQTAERALGSDASEQNVARIRAIEAQRAVGVEAMIEGFGEASGHVAREP